MRVARIPAQPPTPPSGMTSAKLLRINLATGATKFVEPHLWRQPPLWQGRLRIVLPQTAAGRLIGNMSDVLRSKTLQASLIETARDLALRAIEHEAGMLLRHGLDPDDKFQTAPRFTAARARIAATGVSFSAQPDPAGKALARCIWRNETRHVLVYRTVKFAATDTLPMILHTLVHEFLHAGEINSETFKWLAEASLKAIQILANHFYPDQVARAKAILSAHPYFQAAGMDLHDPELFKHFIAVATQYWRELLIENRAGFAYNQAIHADLYPAYLKGCVPLRSHFLLSGGHPSRRPEYVAYQDMLTSGRWFDHLFRERFAAQGRSLMPLHELARQGTFFARTSSAQGTDEFEAMFVLKLTGLIEAIGVDVFLFYLASILPNFQTPGARFPLLF